MVAVVHNPSMDGGCCGSIFDTPVVDFNDFDEKIENVIESSLD